jgi:hypothetical protein
VIFFNEADKIMGAVVTVDHDLKHRVPISLQYGPFRPCTFSIHTFKKGLVFIYGEWYLLIADKGLVLLSLNEVE